MFGQAIIPLPTVEIAPGASMPDPVLQLPAARQLRSMVQNRYNEAIAYCMPGKIGIDQSADALAVYDDVQADALAEFGSNMQEGIIPAFARWTSFMAGFQVPDDQRAAVTAKLESVDRFLFEQVSSSNFTLEAGEALLDLGIGTGAIDISPSLPGSRSNFTCRAISPGNLLFLIGPDGSPDPIYEARKGYAHHAKVMFPGAKNLEAHQYAAGAEIEYIECYARDWTDPGKHRYRHLVFVPGCDNAVLLDEWVEGEGSCSKIVFRWSKGSGEGWGRGPAVRLLPSIRKCNFAEQALLDHTEWQLAGLWQVEDDGVVNPETVRLDPGTLIPIAMGSEGLKNIGPGGDFNVANFVLENARKNIKAGFYNDELGDPNKSPKTATEIDARVATRARRIGTPMIRTILEFVMPSVARFVYILKQRGLLKLPTIDGKQIMLVPTSPLAQAQRFEEMNIKVAYAERITATFGREGVALLIDENRFADGLAEDMRFPKGVLRTLEEKQKMLKNGAAIAQSQPGGQSEPGSAGPAPVDGPPAPQGEPAPTLQ